jgi:hypothetical protein
LGRGFLPHDDSNDGTQFAEVARAMLLDGDVPVSVMAYDSGFPTEGLSLIGEM